MARITEVVEVFEVSTGQPPALDHLKDPVSGRYRVPVHLNQDWADEWFKNSLKYLKKQEYMERPDTREENFELEWPSMWATWMEGPKEGEKLPERFIAVLDTGYMTEHPLLLDSVEEAVDFTGEGIEDRNGHGTVCALLALGTTSRIPVYHKLRLLIVKVAGEDGKGSSENLIKGLRWLIWFKNVWGLEEGYLTANLSLGVYSRRWGVLGCQGNCAVCSAAVVAAEQGIVIAAAAGNKPGVTACPARAGVTGKHEMIVAQGASDYENSGIGALMVPLGHVGFVKLDM